MVTWTCLLTLFLNFKIVVISLTATINELLTLTRSAVVEIALESSPKEQEGWSTFCYQQHILRCEHVKQIM